MNDKLRLPKNTPKQVISWVKKVEGFYLTQELRQLSYDATLNEIKAAYDSDRSKLIGIGEGLYEAARWDAWPE